MDRVAYKAERKDKNKKRHGANFRNFVSGALNGIMMPITMFGSVFVGVPAYYIANSLNRYFVGNHEEKNKNLKGYVENLRTNTSLLRRIVNNENLVIENISVGKKLYSSAHRVLTNRFAEADLRGEAYVFVVEHVVIPMTGRFGLRNGIRIVCVKVSVPFEFCHSNNQTFLK